MRGLVTIQVPPSEAIDKLTILEIKADRIKDDGKLDEVHRARETIVTALIHILPATRRTAGLMDDLRSANEAIWDAEETLRRPDVTITEILDASETARKNNDKRAGLKREIDLLLDAPFSEVKSHDNY